MTRALLIVGVLYALIFICAVFDAPQVARVFGHLAMGAAILPPAGGLRG